MRARWPLLFCAAVASGCTNQSAAQITDGGTTDPSCSGIAAQSLDTLWTRYLSPTPSSGKGGCAQSGCHANGAGGMQFTTPAAFAGATVNIASSAMPSEMRVAPGDPTHSYLYYRLSPQSPIRMPPGGPFLDSSDLDQIAGWICAGAPSATQLDGGVPEDGGGGDLTPPTFAGAASAVAAPSSIALSWTAATDDTTASAQIVYLVYQASAAGAESYAAPSYTTAPGATSFTVGKLSINTKYYFVVRARDQAGNVDANTVEVSATTPANADTTPPIFAGASTATASGTAINLGWSAASDDVSAPSQLVYLVYQANAAGAESYATPSFTTAPGATSFSVSGLTPNTTYYFVVRAEDQAGNIDSNTKEVSALTSIVHFATGVAPIFSRSCTGAGCHSSTKALMPAEGLDLSSASIAYSDLVNVASAECSATLRVKPSAPSASYLAWKLQGSGSCFFGSKMPKTGSISSADYDAIIGWIAEGAPNN